MQTKWFVVVQEPKYFPKKHNGYFSYEIALLYLFIYLFIGIIYRNYI